MPPMARITYHRTDRFGFSACGIILAIPHHYVQPGSNPTPNFANCQSQIENSHPTGISPSRVVIAIHHSIPIGASLPSSIAADSTSSPAPGIVTGSCDTPTLLSALTVKNSSRSPGICGSAHSIMRKNSIRSTRYVPTQTAASATGRPMLPPRNPCDIPRPNPMNVLIFIPPAVPAAHPPSIIAGKSSHCADLGNSPGCAPSIESPAVLLSIAAVELDAKTFNQFHPGESISTN